MVTPNYTPGIGGLVLNRYDAENHFDGIAFRHNANQIDVDPSIIIGGISYTNVADALTAISDFIATETNGGQGFIAIGDGYDTYANADGNPNFDPTVPSIDGLLNEIFTHISTYYNNPNATNLAAIPSQYLRIKDGGVILIKSGTYVVKNTIIVPPGITIIGEGFGTKIVNQTSPQAPLFQISPDVSLVSGTRVSDAGVDSMNMFMFARATQFLNLVIADNFVEPTSNLAYPYTTPNNTIQPLISIKEGASLVCNNVKFLGKTVYLGGNVINSSALPVGLDSTIPSTTGTSLSITNCNIDGFSQAIQFNVIGSAINSYLSFKNNQVRVYGLIATIAISSNGQSLPQSTINVSNTARFPSSGTILVPTSAGTQTVSYTGITSTSFTGCSSGTGAMSTSNIVSNIVNNCFLNLNNSNIDASYNYCYGNKNNISSFVYLNKGATDVTSFKHPNITVANNNASVDRTSGSSSFVFFGISADSSINSKYLSFTYNNNNSNNTTLSMAVNSSDSIPQIQISDGSIIFGTTNIEFTNAPNIGVATTIGSPNTMELFGQTTTQASTSGGELSIAAGNGTAQGGSVSISGGTGSTYGDVDVFGNTLNIQGVQNVNLTGALVSLNGNLNIGSWFGAVNTQSKNVTYYAATTRTFDTSQTVIFTFTLPTNNTIALIEVQYIAKAVGTFASYGGKYYNVYTNNNGSVLTPGGGSTGIIYSYGSATSLTFTNISTMCQINVNGIAATILDWEVVISVVIN